MAIETKCPCGTNINYESCCGPYLTGEAKPDTAEKLMRSRYTAHTRGDLEYIKRTMAPERRKEFDPVATRKWSEESKWKGLKIVDTKKGGPEDSKGVVEFVATYERNGVGIEHHEVSEFRKSENGEWLFVDGEGHEHEEGKGHHDAPRVETVVRASAKVGRNEPCPCGSGKKFKKCCESA